MGNTFVFGALAALSVWQACAQEEMRQAQITGKPGGPKCTIEVEVDQVADVEIHGTVGRIHTLSGSPSVWRRFECNVPMPPNPANFRFRGIDGRGRQTLIGDPMRTGVAVVRIEDPKSGREGYTFDLEWNGAMGPGGPGPNYPPVRPVYPRPGPGGDRDQGFDADDAIHRCADAAQDQLRRNGYNAGRILEAKMDGDAGRGDWVYGKIAGRRGPREETFGFACPVDFQARRIGPVNLRPSDDGYYGGDRDDQHFSKERAIHACSDSVQDRLRDRGYVTFEMRRINVDDQPGRNDSIVGNLVASRRNGDRDRFEFSCSVDFDGGRIRSINVNRAFDRR
jgi:hypothetical protein